MTVASQVYLRLSASRRADHDDGNTTGVEEAARHCAVQLGRCHVLALGNVMDAIDKGRALAAVSRCIRRDLSGPYCVSSNNPCEVKNANSCRDASN